jgi:hypothetical protein
MVAKTQQHSRDTVFFLGKLRPQTQSRQGSVRLQCLGSGQELGSEILVELFQVHDEKMMASNATYTVGVATKVLVQAFAKGHALFPLYSSPGVNENEAIPNVTWVCVSPFIAQLFAVGIVTYASILNVRHGGQNLLEDGTCSRTRALTSDIPLKINLTPKAANPSRSIHIR